MKGKVTQEGVYAKAEDNTLQDLMRFQDFLYRNFSNQEKYDDMGYQDFAQLIRDGLLLKKMRNMYLIMSSRYLPTFPIMTPKNIVQKKSTPIINYQIYVAN